MFVKSLERHVAKGNFSKFTKLIYVKKKHSLDTF